MGQTLSQPLAQAHLRISAGLSSYHAEMLMINLDFDGIMILWPA
jgi:hypothetical protein